MTPRYARFFTIGVLGFIVQIGALWILTAVAQWSWLPATVASVELAIVHNYLWHQRWTWRDRPGRAVARFCRFQMANGLASIAGNAALMALFTGLAGMPLVPANAAAVAVLSVANFIVADRWVFTRRERLHLAAPLCAVCLMTPSFAHAQAAESIAAWDRYVATVETGLERSRSRERLRPTTDSVPAEGESIRIQSATISDWRGSVFIPGITLDRLLDRLQHPGTPPPQDEVVASRVLGRTDDSLRLWIRLARHVIVTVTYDTEHEMRFRRWTPQLATARSVATRIAESGGTDHGFLWRLHSYWRYEQIDGGVLIELRSLTLSRDVPSIIRPIAAPLVNRVARESVDGTLGALRRYLVHTL
jgi:putative flippase GtrA